MSLYPVRAADDQDPVIQHLEGTLHFRREIHMSRSIQQGDLLIFQAEDCLL